MGRPLTKSVRTLQREQLIGLNVDFDDESKKEEREIFWRWWWTEEWFATENEVEPVGTCVTDFLSYYAEQLVQFLTTSTTRFKHQKRLYRVKADKDTCYNYFKLVGHTKLLYKDM